MQVTQGGGLPDLGLNPVTRLVVWLSLLVAVQSLQAAWLGGACLLPLLLGRRIVRRGGRLVWRARWVLVSVAVFFSWGVAGDPLWAGFGAPTVEGLHLALTHIGRLYLVLMVLGAFLQSMPLPDMLAAAHVLLRPFRGIGLEPDRGVIRLMLVLEYVENLPRPRDWRSLLVAAAPREIGCVEVNIHPICRRDVFAILALTTFYACLFWAMSGTKA